MIWSISRQHLMPFETAFRLPDANSAIFWSPGFWHFSWPVGPDFDQLMIWIFKEMGLGQEFSRIGLGCPTADIWCYLRRYRAYRTRFVVSFLIWLRYSRLWSEQILLKLPSNLFKREYIIDDLCLEMRVSTRKLQRSPLKKTGKFATALKPTLSQNGFPPVYTANRVIYHNFDVLVRNRR